MRRAFYIALFLSALLCPSITRADGLAPPHDLRCEYLVNPLGIDVAKPRLSWKLTGDAQGMRQTAYRIAVASTRENLAFLRADLWDSGEVQSDRSVHVEYAGKPLASRTHCYWSVQFRDEHGKWSAWANPAEWSMGLLADTDWAGAKWIGLDEAGPEAAQEHRRLPARYLRKRFRVEHAVRRATASVCGLGFCDLTINDRNPDGKRRLNPGLTEYSKRCLYDTYEIPQLSVGDNEIEVALANGRFFAPRLTVPVRTVTFGYPKLLLNLHIEFEDGTSRDINSDESWEITTDGPIRSSSEYDGEEFDARLASFEGAKWRPAPLVKSPGGAIESQMIQPVRVTQWLKPVSITEPKPGVFVVDFGQAFYGMTRLSIPAGQPGTRVEMRSSFSLRPDGTLNTDNDRSAKNTDVYITDRQGTGQDAWSPRYKGTATRRVEIRGYPGKLRAKDVYGLVAHTDHESVGEFKCSNELINKIYANAVWGTRMQNRSIPMEPDRDERQGWSGHPAKTSESEGFVFNVAPFYASWLHSVRLDQHPDGSLQEISPGYWTFSSNGTVWPAIVTIIPNWLYDFYGDDRAIADNYEAMKRWVEYHIRTNQKPDGAIDQGTYGDWVDASWIGHRGTSPPPNTGASLPFVSTAYHYNNCRLLARAAKLLGKSDDAKRYDENAAMVKGGFIARFFKPNEDKFDAGNQFSYVLPLAFGLVPDDHRQRVIDNLVRRIMETDKGHTSVGLLGMQWQMQVLTDAGHPEVAYAIATQTTQPSWGYMIAKGATSIWERWDTDTQDPSMNGESQKILSGNFEAWCYQTLAGINYDPDKPGFKHVILRPRPVGDLTFVTASHESMYGTIRSAWKRTGEAFSWDVVVPPNSTASVFVPGEPEPREVGSGTYHFESRLR